MGIGAGSTRSAEEQFAAAMAFFGFPMIDAIVLIGTEKVSDSSFSLKLFPLLFAALAALLCRVLGVGFWWGLVYTLGCAAACWLGAACLGIFDAFFLPW